jgi:hypothetical protein
MAVSDAVRRRWNGGLTAERLSGYFGRDRPAMLPILLSHDEKETLDEVERAIGGAGVGISARLADMIFTEACRAAAQSAGRQLRSQCRKGAGTSDRWHDVAHLPAGRPVRVRPVRADRRPGHQHRWGVR